MKRLIYIVCASFFLYGIQANAQSWRILHEFTEPFPESLLRNLYFVNDSIGWVVGFQNLLYKTVDAGSSWINQSFTEDVSLKPISFSEPSLTGFVGLNTNKSYFTINSGNIWDNIPPIAIPNLDITSTRISDIQFVSPDTAWLITETGSIHKSVNGGVDWTLNAYYPNIKFEDIHFLDQETGWICGYHIPISVRKGYILKTENGGETWELNLENTTGTYGSFNTIQFINKYTGWSTGGDNQLFKTTNGGDSWVTTVIDPVFGDENFTLLVHKHFFVNDTLGWLSCLPFNETYKNLIYITLDGGATWRRQSIERDSTVERLFMTSPVTGYAVTRLGRVLRYEARPAECGALSVFPVNGAENIPLQPLLRWQHPDPGGTDGYRIALGTAPGMEDLLPLTDVGLDTFFVPPAPLPPNTLVYVSLYPYSQYFGEAACSDTFNFTTIACPAPTMVEAGICKNDTLLFADSLITTAGVYEWTYALSSGCDSTVQLLIDLLPDVVTQTDTLLPSGQPYNGMVYEQDTTLEFVLQTIHGCDSIVRVTIDIVTSTLPSPSNTFAIEVFPNPARGEATLRFSQAPAQSIRLYFFNTLGQVTRIQKLPAHRHENRLSLEGLPSGSYRLIGVADGVVVALGKMVVL